MRAARPLWLAFGLILALAAGVADQATAQSIPAQQIYTLDQDRLFGSSAFGMRVLHEIEQRSAAIAQESRQIEAELRDEEQALTDQRASLPAAEFRSLADAFDARVEALRQAQAQKSFDLNAWTEAEQKRFFEAAFPILVTMAEELGALAIFDQRSAIIASDQVDLTDRAIARINAEIGDGTRPAQE
ncbi:MAG: OmpH family outer membrane protein [Rhodobacteraceae bacterium]|nr:OmpH family outer membrane protein [Paracoccaceae bacterium]